MRGCNLQMSWKIDSSKLGWPCLVLPMMTGWLKLLLKNGFMDFFQKSGFMDVFLALDSLERRSLIMRLCNSLSRMSPSSWSWESRRCLDFRDDDVTLGSEAALSLWTLLDWMTLLNALTTSTMRVRRARKLTVSNTKVLVFAFEGMKTCRLVLSKSETNRASLSPSFISSSLWNLEYDSTQIQILNLKYTSKIKVDIASLISLTQHSLTVACKDWVIERKGLKSILIRIHVWLFCGIVVVGGNFPMSSAGRSEPEWVSLLAIF